MHLLRRKGSSLDFRYLRHKEMALVAVRIFVSVGSQWFFGFLFYIIKDNKIVEYLFVCTTSLQGTFCFLCVVTTRLVRKKVKVWARKRCLCNSKRVQPSTMVVADLRIRGGHEVKCTGELAVEGIGSGDTGDDAGTLEGDAALRERVCVIHRENKINDEIRVVTEKRDSSSSTQKSVVRKSLIEHQLSTLVENEENEAKSSTI